MMWAMRPLWPAPGWCHYVIWGAALSAHAAWNLLQGLETLSLRIERICANTLAVAKHLESHSLVTWVHYAGLENHPDHALAQRYMNGHALGILSFGIEGGQAAGERFYDALADIDQALAASQG